MKAHNRDIARNKEIRLRKHLNAYALLATMQTGFAKVEDHRPRDVQHSLADVLMSGFAMFALKDTSLLAFDERQGIEPHNLKTIYGMRSIPCDTSMREILDGVVLDDLRPLFKNAFQPLQRGKALKKMVLMNDCYLLNLDGTDYFSSNTLYSDACMKKKNSKTGKVSYYLQAVGTALVHPYYKEVIALCPEIIRKQAGKTKMDCERNAIKLMLVKLRQDHPHLKFINEDALSSNAPNIEDLEEYNLHYILGVKEGDHKSLFQCIQIKPVKRGEAVELTIADNKNADITHYFRIIHNAPLNKSNQDRLVTFVEYWEDTQRPVAHSVFAGLLIWTSLRKMSTCSCMVLGPDGK